MAHPRLRRSALVIALGLLLGFLTPLAATARVSPDDDPGSPVTSSDLSIAYRLVDAVFNDEDASAATALVAEDAVIHTRLGDHTGPQGLLAYIAAMKHTYPGASFSIIDVSPSARGVTIDWLMTATNIRMGASEQMTSVTIELRSTTVLSTNDGQVDTATFDPSLAARPDTSAYGPMPGQRDF